MKVKVGDKVSEGSLLLTLVARSGCRRGSRASRTGRTGGFGRIAGIASASASARGRGLGIEGGAVRRAGERRLRNGPGTDIVVPDIGDFDRGRRHRGPGQGRRHASPSSRASSPSRATRPRWRFLRAPPACREGATRSSCWRQDLEGQRARRSSRAAAAAATAPAAPVGGSRGCRRRHRHLRPQLRLPRRRPPRPLPCQPRSLLLPTESCPLPACLHRRRTRPPARCRHASPSIRKLARELGVPLAEVAGSAPKGRITQDDLQAFVTAVMAGGHADEGAGRAHGSGRHGGARSRQPAPSAPCRRGRKSISPSSARSSARSSRESGRSAGRCCTATG